jgi:putative endonuclease
VQFGAAQHFSFFKMWFVYIIKCRDSSLYTGSTNNLHARFEKHKKGKGAKYTRSHKPKEIVFFEKHAKKIVALRREREIKKLTRKEKLEFLRKQKMSGR